jgi:hypothetical protein
MLKYPRITQWHCSAPLANLGEQGEDVDCWNAFFDTFFRKVRPLLGDGPAERLRLTVVQLRSALLFPGMVPAFFREFARQDLRDEEVAARYIDRLLAHLLAPSNP